MQHHGDSDGDGDQAAGGHSQAAQGRQHHGAGAGQYSTIMHKGHDDKYHSGVPAQYSPSEREGHDDKYHNGSTAQYSHSACEGHHDNYHSNDANFQSGGGYDANLQYGGGYDANLQSDGGYDAHPQVGAGTADDEAPAGRTDYAALARDAGWDFPRLQRWGEVPRVLQRGQR